MVADSTGTRLAAAGKYNVVAKVDMCILGEAGSRCIREAVDRGNAEVAVAHNILAEEAGRHIFEAMAGRNILGPVDSKRLVFQLVDSGIWIRPLPSEAPKSLILNSKDKSFDFSALAHVKEELENGLERITSAFKGITVYSVLASETAEALRLYISNPEEDLAKPDQAHYYSALQV